MKDVNEKSLQLVSAYLSGLQRKEYVASISVVFFTKLQKKSLPRELLDLGNLFIWIFVSYFILIVAAPVELVPHRITLASKDLLTSVNSILSALDLPTVEKSKQQKQTDQNDLQYKVIEIEKFYDFIKIPKLSIKFEIENFI